MQNMPTASTPYTLPQQLPHDLASRRRDDIANAVGHRPAIIGNFEAYVGGGVGGVSSTICDAGPRGTLVRHQPGNLRPGAAHISHQELNLTADTQQSEYFQMQHNLQTKDLDTSGNHSQRGGSGIGGEARERDLLGTHIHTDNIGQEDTMLDIRRTRDTSRDLDLNLDISGRSEEVYDVPIQHDSTTFVHSQTTGGDSSQFQPIDTPNVSRVRARLCHLYL